jgi:hypothetical protein
VAQEELAHDAQLLLAPEPPRLGDDECTAKLDRRRRTSFVEHSGQSGLSPLRTSSSNWTSQ